MRTCGAARTSAPFHHILMSCFCKLLDKHECCLRASCKRTEIYFVHVFILHQYKKGNDFGINKIIPKEKSTSQISYHIEIYT
jgi:hypothetical protein